MRPATRPSSNHIRTTTKNFKLKSDRMRNYIYMLRSVDNLFSTEILCFCVKPKPFHVGICLWCCCCRTWRWVHVANAIGECPRQFLWYATGESNNYVMWDRGRKRGIQKQKSPYVRVYVYWLFIQSVLTNGIKVIYRSSARCIASEDHASSRFRFYHRASRLAVDSSEIQICEYSRLCQVTQFTILCFMFISTMWSSSSGTEWKG